MMDKIGIDGYKHIVVSAVLTVLLRLFLPIWVATIITITVGIGKELYDKFSKKGYAEWKDIICDIIGILIGIL